MRSTSKSQSRVTSEENQVVVEESRVARLEQKIDHVIETLGELKRVDERVITLFKQQGAMLEEFREHEKKLSEVRDRVLVASSWGTFIKSLGLVALGAIVTMGVKVLMGGTP